MKKILLGLLVVAYPLIVYFGLQYVEPGIIAAVFAIFFLIRHFSQKSSNPAIPNLNGVAVVVLGLLGFSMIANSALALKFYPVAMSLSFLIIFGYSLYKPPTVVEVIARLTEELDQAGVTYTRKVTKVWCLFFSTNALVACWTIFEPNPQVWLIYNGLISYVLMGCLMLGEFLIRQRVKRLANHEPSK
ncbi:MAG: hypothetical protein HRU24_09950 [Gammaproteobacteria bacterium]|nr:hypothetical protein [Gammaproteobacteria bacterium]